MMPGGLWGLFHFQHLLHTIKQAVRNNTRNAAFHPDVIVNINAAVALIAADRIKAAFGPRAAALGFDAAPVQIRRNIHKRLPAGHPRVNFLNHGSLRLIQHNAAVLPCLVPQWQRAVAQALAGIIHHAAGDVLCHILAVELVDVHHIAQRKAAGSGIVKIFLRVKGPYAPVFQAGFIGHGLQHIAAHTVGLPRQHAVKITFFRIPQQVLKAGAAVGFAADGFILVSFHHIQPQPHGQFPAGFDLLFNGCFPLVVRRIARIDRSPAMAGIWLLLFHGITFWVCNPARKVVQYGCWSVVTISPYGAI